MRFQILDECFHRIFEWLSSTTLHKLNKDGQVQAYNSKFPKIFEVSCSVLVKNEMACYSINPFCPNGMFINDILYRLSKEGLIFDNTHDEYYDQRVALFWKILTYK